MKIIYSLLFLTLSLCNNLSRANTSEERLALIGATVISPQLASPIDNAVVLIRDGIIESIGPKTTIIDDSYQKVDLEGKWLIPGYIDPHVHFFQSASIFTRPDNFDFSNIQAYKIDRKWVENHLDDTFARYLQSGITSVIDMGGPSWNFKMKERANQLLMAPKVSIAGPLISTFDAPQIDAGDTVFQKVKSSQDAVKYVQQQIKLKPDLIKFVWAPDHGESPKQLFDIFSEAFKLAKQENFPIAVHVQELENVKLAIKAGANILVHSITDQYLDDEVINLIKQYKVIVMPTLAVENAVRDIAMNQFKFSATERKLGHKQIIDSFKLAAEHSDLFSEQTKMIHKYAAYINSSEEQLNKLSEQEQSIVKQLANYFSEQAGLHRTKNLMRLYEEGVTLALGTDAGNPGMLHGASIQKEMKAWSEAGIPLAAILKSATLNSAKVAEFDKIVGSIEKGKVADLVILDKDPLLNVSHFSAIKALVKNGHYLNIEQINAHINNLAKEQK